MKNEEHTEKYTFVIELIETFNCTEVGVPPEDASTQVIVRANNSVEAIKKAIDHWVGDDSWESDSFLSKISIANILLNVKGIIE